MKNEKAFSVNDISFKISSFAVQAMIYEVSCFPSPGLVSPVSSGAHKDMDFYTFVDSTSALSKYMILFVQEGFSNNSCKDIFNSIRNIGKEAEEEMFSRTKGINTHKGMLFLMGIACAAVGKAIYENKDFNEIHCIIKEMTVGLVEKELVGKDDKGTLSNGERLYIKHKIKGIRGEAEEGIPIVFNFSLDFYKNSAKLSINDRLVHTLIGIMQFCDDSTIIHRHDPKVLFEVQEKAKKIINAGGMENSEGKEMIYELCSEFIDRNISPGGSADLLGVTVFLYLVERFINNLTLN